MEEPSIPSVLDSPRFFDDESLSSWKMRGGEDTRARVASKEEMHKRNVRLYASNGQASSRIAPDDDVDPIGIELVRGANGVLDDSWTVVVDGLVQVENVTLVKSEDDEDAGRNVYVCRLPPGVELNKPITTDTVVRPIVVGVRLENEALHPSYVELSVEQVLESSEREARGESDKKQIQSGIELKPYRVSDITASGVTMPYPYWTPPQSAVGVLSFKEANREAERNRATQLYNMRSIFLNGLMDEIYNGRKAAYDEIKAAQWIQGNTVDLFNTIKKYNNKLVWREEDKIKANFESFQARIQPPKRPKLYALKTQASFLEPITYDTSNSVSLQQTVALNQSNKDFQDPSSPKAKGSFVIGGTQKSAAKELAEMFREFTEVCEVVNTELKESYAKDWWGSTKLAIKEQIAAMRFALMTKANSPKLVALFDALFTTNPFPGIASLVEIAGLSESNTDDPFIKRLRRKFHFPKKETGTGEDQFEVEELTAEKRAELVGESLEAIDDNALKVAPTNADYAFMYDRLIWENRRKTALKTQISIRVFDYDNTEEPFEVRFEASERDGFAAHSVYTEAQKELNEFNDAAQEFVRCFYKAYMSSKNNFALGALQTARGVVVNDAFLNRKYRNRQGSKFSGIFDILRFIPNQGGNTILSTVSGGAEFKNYNPDPKRLEQRVSELRVVLQYTKPVAPMEDESSVSQEIKDAIQDIADALQRDIQATSLSDPPPDVQAAPTVSDTAVQPTSQDNPPAQVSADGAAAAASNTGSKQPAQDVEDQIRDQETFKQIIADADYLQVRDITVDLLQQVKDKPEAYKLGDLIQYLESDESIFEPTDLLGATRFVNELSTKVQFLLQQLDALALPNDESANKKLIKLTESILEHLTILIQKVERRKLDFRGFAPFNGTAPLSLILTRQLPQIVAVDRQLTFQYSAYLYADVYVNELEEIPSSLLGKVFRLAASGLAGFAAYTFLQFVFKESQAQELASGKSALWASVAVNGAVQLLLNGPSALPVILLSTISPFLVGTAKGLLNQIFSPDWLKNSIGTELFTKLEANGQGFATAVTSSVNIVLAASAWLTSSQTLQGDQLALYNKHLRTLVGRPPNSCVLSGNHATRKIRQAVQELEQSFGILNLPSVVYNASTRKRFVFLEHYHTGSQSRPTILNGLEYVHTKEDWVRVPDSDALTLLPPSDVADKLYECGQLRGIPVSQHYSFTFGKHSIQDVATTPSQLAAHQAFVELYQAVRRSRRNFQGLNLTQTSSSELLRLTSNASQIISAVYSKSGLTLVDGDDILWTCMRSGVAARLSLRHFSIFNESELKHASSLIELAKYWAVPRTQMMIGFAEELQVNSKLFAQASASSVPEYRQRNIRQLAYSIGYSFQAVDALTSPQTTPRDVRDVALALLSSAASHDILLNTTASTLGEKLAEFKSEFDKGFSDGFGLIRQLPQKPGVLPQLDSAWASRRVDTHTSRKWKYGSGDGVSELISSLSGVRLDDAEGKTYYCSMGSRIERTNPNSMFMVTALSNQMLSLQALSNALFALKSKLFDSSSSTSSSSMHIDTRASAVSQLSGASKHPLALELLGNKVTVPLCTPEDAYPVEYDPSLLSNGKAVPTTFERQDDLFNALNSFLSFESNVQYETVRTKIRLARRVAFDAERLMFALELSAFALQNKELSSKEPGIDVYLSGSATQLVSLAIGMAMKHERDGYLPRVEKVFMDSKYHSDGIKWLTQLAQRVDVAYDAYNVLSCKLSEFVVCM